jgi:hypothetical protein
MELVKSSLDVGLNHNRHCGNKAVVVFSNPQTGGTHITCGVGSMPEFKTAAILFSAAVCGKGFFMNERCSTYR